MCPQKGAELFGKIQNLTAGREAPANRPLLVLGGWYVESCDHTKIEISLCLPKQRLACRIVRQSKDGIILGDVSLVFARSEENRCIYRSCCRTCQRHVGSDKRYGTSSQ